MMVYKSACLIVLQIVYLACQTRGQTNVALTSKGSQCEASQPDCQRAFDGYSALTNTIHRWGFFSEAQGNWINVTFNQKYIIYTARFMQLGFAEESNFKDLQLTFDDGSQQQINLTIRQDGFQWEEFTLNPPVETTSVDVLVLTAYTTGRTYNGFSEIEFYDGLLTTTTPTTTAIPTTTTPATTTVAITTANTSPVTTTTTPAATTVPSTPIATTTVPTTTPAATTTIEVTTMTSTSTSPTITSDSTSSPSTSSDPTTTSLSTTAPPTSIPTATEATEDTASSSVSPSLVTSTSAASASSVSSTESVDVSTTATVAETTEKQQISRELMVAIIIIAIFGFLLLILFTILIAKVCCRSKSSKKENKPTVYPVEVPVSPANGVRPHSLDYDSLTKTSDTPVRTIPPSNTEKLKTDTVPSRPIKIPDLGQAIIKLSIDDGFGDEFREIPSGETGKITAGKRSVNIRKNRFRNIFPFDDNRVQLSRLDDSDDTDYVNASLVRGYDKDEMFIAAQGPTKLTIPDWWRMIWENNCGQVVMVTNLYEKGRQKCDQYWPDDGSDKHWEIDLKILREETFPGYTIRDFELTKGSETKQVKQYHYTSWPDEGVPDTCTDVLAMIERVKAHSVPGRGPIVIHCSAGVGRTGTYIALSNLYKQAQAEGEIDVFKCVHLLRAARMNMVQSLAQYRFIYLAMIEWLECKFVSIPCEDFSAVYPLVQKETEGEPTVLAKQYEILDVFIPRDYKESCEAAQEATNSDKNRDPDILPSDDVRPILSPVDGRSDYINAVFTKGYKKPFAQLITQMPLESTVIEFWRMVSDFKVMAIVMMNSNPADEQPYWPTEENQKVELGGLFSLSNAAVATVRNVTITDIYMTNKDIGDEAVLVKHFRLTAPPPEDELPAEDDLLDLYHTVSAWMKATDDSRVAVHCLKGYERSGLFCATHHIIEKINNEHEVDVFNAVKQARLGRPELIPDLTQYSHLYKVADTYLHLFDTYSNFKLPEEVEEEEESQTEENPYINVSSLGSIKEEESEVEENNNEEAKEDQEEDKEEEKVEEDQASLHHLVIEVE